MTKPYTPADPTPHEEAIMRELREKCVIEAYGPYEVRVDFNRFGHGFAIDPNYAELIGYGFQFSFNKGDRTITPEVIAAARARLNLSLLELDLLERGIKAMEE